MKRPHGAGPITPIGNNRNLAFMDSQIRRTPEHWTEIISGWQSSGLSIPSSARGLSLLTRSRTTSTSTG